MVLHGEYDTAAALMIAVINKYRFICDCCCSQAAWKEEEEEEACQYL